MCASSRTGKWLGKTYTMAGGGPVRDAVDLESWAVARAPASSRGAASRSSAFLMKGPRSTPTRWSCPCELYRDALRDLLADRKDKKPLFVFRRLHPDATRTHRSRTQVRQARAARADGSPPSRAASVVRRVARGARGATGQGPRAARRRAHGAERRVVAVAVVSIVLTSTNRRSGKKTRGKSCWWTWPGPERVEKSGVQGDELKEAASINKS